MFGFYLVQRAGSFLLRRQSLINLSVHAHRQHPVPHFFAFRLHRDVLVSSFVRIKFQCFVCGSSERWWGCKVHHGIVETEGVGNHWKPPDGESRVLVWREVCVLPTCLVGRVLSSTRGMLVASAKSELSSRAAFPSSMASVRST